MRYGIWNSISDVNVISLLSKFHDFVILDLEHGYRDFEELQSGVLLLSALNVDFSVRVRNYQDPHLQSLLDLGVTSFVLPQTRSLHEIKEFENKLLYPPNGRRGNHPRFKLGNQDFLTVKDLIHENNLIKIILIVETPELLLDIEKVSTISSISELYLGVYDLSLEMQLEFGVEDLNLLPIYQKISQVCKANLFEFSCMETLSMPVKRLREFGVTKVLRGVDIVFLAEILKTKQQRDLR